MIKQQTYGDDEDIFFSEDFVSCKSGGSVGSLSNDLMEVEVVEEGLWRWLKRGDVEVCITTTSHSSSTNQNTLPTQQTNKPQPTK